MNLGGSELTVPVRDLAQVQLSGAGPVRWFSWHRRQRHRPELQYMVSTGRHHGFESLEEARVLLALDFASRVRDVVPQPLKLEFRTGDGRRVHVPDFLVLARTGVCLVDVRPLDRVRTKDAESFAAAFEAALACGWDYVLAARWRPHVLAGLDVLSSQRRPLPDPLGLRAGLLDAARSRVTFGELAEGSAVPALARAELLHLFWHRSIGIDLTVPLTDRSLVEPAVGAP
ncbi:TnsA-like heteromeric transposase endonuclease subunit [Streptomyces sp. B21-083]|uniref:TnsA-like heteromeric transposase endonuclease subunit n=1 Tax=Streptomyces sp. B21-083 TaxID=3039410 RepID=UPI002FF14160